MKRGLFLNQARELQLEEPEEDGLTPFEKQAKLLSTNFFLCLFSSQMRFETESRKGQSSVQSKI